MWLLLLLSGATEATAQTPPIRRMIRGLLQREGKWVFAKGVQCAIPRDMIGYFFYFGTYEKTLEVSTPTSSCADELIS